MRAPNLLAATLLSLLTLQSLPAANLTPHGGFESGVRGDRPAEYWHRAGGDYLSAWPDWRVTDKQKASGKRCVTTDTTREFIVCGEGGGGWITGSVMLRAAKPGTKARVRLSWWNRLRRADTTQVVTVGPKWQRYSLKTEAIRGQPMEIAVRAEKPGARLWADDFRIEGKPVADQLIDRVYNKKRELVTRPFKGVRPRPIDLSRLQRYRGKARDKTGQVKLSVHVPKDCVELPCVSGGVPFPRGEVFRRERIGLFSGLPSRKGQVTWGGKIGAFGTDNWPRSCQVDVLSRWPADGSIMVALITIFTPKTSTSWVLKYGPKVSPHLQSIGPQLPLGHPSSPASSGAKHWAYPRVGIEHGQLGLLSLRNVRSQTVYSGGCRSGLAFMAELRDSRGAPRGRCVWRIDSLGPPDDVRHVSFRWVNDAHGPSMPIRSASLTFHLPGAAAKRVTQVARGKQYAVSGDDVARPPKKGAPDKRHDGLFGGRVAVRDFWQNHPMAVESKGKDITVWLWPETVRGVLIPQGFARQWDFLIDPKGKLTKPYRTEAMPVLRADPTWMCASGVFEFVMPPDPKTFPIFEQRVSRSKTLGRFSLARKKSGNLYGVFNYGDAPGDGGWANLESMAAHELFLHWIRMPSREHYDMARLAAEHYRDIDIHHGAGFCHTHCNNHVATSESWSHSWIQGVRDLYFLRGDLAALETLQEIGDRLVTKPAGWTTGRDWTRPLDNLVDIYAATGDKRYLDAVMRQLRELRRRQLAKNAVPGAERHSWYEDRYSAGCAFTWYGCQAMAKLHLLTGDPWVLETLRREIDLSLDVQTKSLRSMRILPGEKLTQDHAAAELGRFALGRGSTLFPPLGYLATHTGDRRYLDFGMKILAHYMLSLRGGGDASATSYATVFLHDARKAGVGPKQEAAAFQRAKDFSYERWPQGVANGGFEMDDFKHWGVKRDPGKNAYYDRLVKVGYFLDDKVRHSGKRSLRLHSDNRFRVMSVKGSFSLKPRRRYRLSLWVKADKTMNPRFAVGLREYDTDVRAGARLRPTGKEERGWREYAADFSTDSRTVMTVTLTNRKGTGDAWFDDVALQDVGKLHHLLTNNGGGREWARKPPYRGLTLDTGGTYTPDKKMSSDPEPEGTPVPFTKGTLTDGVSKYDYRQKPRISYSYWKSRPKGSIVFDLKRPYRVRRVRVNVLIYHKRRSHGTQRIELRLGDAKGKVLGAIDPAVSGWNEFKDLDVEARKLTIVLTRYKNYPYLTLSEVEIWGERRGE